MIGPDRNKMSQSVLMFVCFVWASAQPVVANPALMGLGATHMVAGHVAAHMVAAHGAGAAFAGRAYTSVATHGTVLHGTASVGVAHLGTHGALLPHSYTHSFSANTVGYGTGLSGYPGYGVSSYGYRLGYGGAYGHPGLTYGPFGARLHPGGYPYTSFFPDSSTSYSPAGISSFGLYY